MKILNYVRSVLKLERKPKPVNFENIFSIRPEDSVNWRPAVIKDVAEHYEAKYLGDWTIQDKNKVWVERPFSIFHNARGYFTVYVHNGNTYIADASSAFSQPITALLHKGIVYASKYRHDFVALPNSDWIDGGRDYLRMNAQKSETKVCELKNENGEFKLYEY